MKLKEDVIVTINNIVNQVLINKSKSPVKEVQITSSLRDDLGFDSLDLAELTVRIEDKFGIDIFSDGIVSTIGEILQKINTK
jgi:acyl carrier protein